MCYFTDEKNEKNFVQANPEIEVFFKSAHRHTTMAAAKVPVWKIAVVGISSIPAVAFLQGAWLIYDFKVNHGNAPRPDVPSRGLVVVDNNDKKNNRTSGERHPMSRRESRWFFSSYSNEKKNDTNKMNPLRILVIGDSLAAGVGTKRSGAPVLPDSIAQTLSHKMHGRAVHWTCMGVPGQSASEIVKDIYRLDNLMQGRPMQFMNDVVEWQALQRCRAQDTIEIARHRTSKWFEQREIDTQKVLETSWWSQILRDTESFWKLLFDITTNSNLSEAPLSILSKENGSREHHQTLSRRSSLSPEVIRKYDIAVVLTGLNDMKESFFPFLKWKRKKQNKDEIINASSCVDNGSHSLKDELLRILEALEGQMTRSTSKTAPVSCSEDEKCVKDTSGPLIVFPGMPYEPTSLNQMAPLSWFIGPVIASMDRSKQSLAQSHPALVVYVEPPLASDFSNAASKRGVLWKEDYSVLLRFDDITEHVRNRVETMMKEHYSSWVHDLEDGPQDDLYQLDPFYGVSTIESSSVVAPPGSRFVADDGIHPNDEGYSMWGRHIANAIVEELHRRG